MVTYLPRSAWKARASRGAVALKAAAVDGWAIHWPAMAKPINAIGDAGMARVASALRGWQNYHMDGHGWSDIAYQVAVDQAGRAWTCRGLNIKSAANGDADVNTRFGAILLILAPGEQPSAAMIRTVREIGADFCGRYTGARKKPYGHQDVRPRNAKGEETTECPGPIAEAALNAGTFTPGAAVPTPVTPKPTPVTPPKEEDPFAMLTKQDLTDSFTAALKAVLPAQAAADNSAESVLLNFDNKHDAQAWSYQVAAQAHANKRYPELIAGGAQPRDAMETIRQEVWGFLAPLWTDAKN